MAHWRCSGLARPRAAYSVQRERELLDSAPRARPKTRLRSSRHSQLSTVVEIFLGEPTASPKESGFSGDGGWNHMRRPFHFYTISPQNRFQKTGLRGNEFMSMR